MSLNFSHRITDEEEIYYNEQSNNGTCDGGAGTVDGNLFGYNGTGPFSPRSDLSYSVKLFEDE